MWFATKTNKKSLKLSEKMERSKGGKETCCFFTPFGHLSYFSNRQELMVKLLESSANLWHEAKFPRSSLFCSLDSLSYQGIQVGFRTLFPKFFEGATNIRLWAIFSVLAFVRGVTCLILVIFQLCAYILSSTALQFLQNCWQNKTIGKYFLCGRSILLLSN